MLLLATKKLKIVKTTRIDYSSIINVMKTNLEPSDRKIICKQSDITSNQAIKTNKK